MINWFVFLWLLFHWFCPFGVVCLLSLLHFMYYFVLIWLFKNLIIISFAQWISIFLFSKKEHTFLSLLHSNSEFRFDLVCVCVYDFLLDLQLFNMIHFSIIFHLPSNKYSLKILYFSYFSQQLHSSNFFCPIFMFFFRIFSLKTKPVETHQFGSKWRLRLFSNATLFRHRFWKFQRKKFFLSYDVVWSKSPTWMVKAFWFEQFTLTNIA